jgi:hypothetical protein
MPQADTETAKQHVNIELAKLFFDQACRAYAAGQLKTFEAARVLAFINLGLSTENNKL